MQSYLEEVCGQPGPGATLAVFFKSFPMGLQSIELEPSSGRFREVDSGH